MYLLGLWVIGILNLAAMISGLASANGGVIIAVLIFTPLFCVAEIVMLRIFCEICVVILLLPYYMERSGARSAGSGPVERLDVATDDDDLNVSTHSKFGDAAPLSTRV